jgi:hypothetical protein
MVVGSAPLADSQGHSYGVNLLTILRLLACQTHTLAGATHINTHTKAITDYDTNFVRNGNFDTNGNGSPHHNGSAVLTLSVHLPCLANPTKPTDPPTLYPDRRFNTSLLTSIKSLYFIGCEWHGTQ